MLAPAVERFEALSEDEKHDFRGQLTDYARIRSRPRAPHRESVLALALKRGEALVLTAELGDPLRHSVFLAHDPRELKAAGYEHGGVAVVATAFVDDETLGTSRGGALHGTRTVNTSSINSC